MTDRETRAVGKVSRVRKGHLAFQIIQGAKQGSATSCEAIIGQIRKGFNWKAVARFQEAYGLKSEKVAQLVGISDRTFTRHRKQEEPLDAVASDRLYRVSRVIEFATEVFEDKGRAMQWLWRPQPALGDQVPLELLDTEPGSQAVQTLLTQIEYSVLP